MIERLEIFINSLHISMRSFETSIGASNGTIRNAIKKKADIQSRLISAILYNYPQLNIDWLLTGRGQMSSPNIQPAEYPINEMYSTASAPEVEYQKLDYKEKYISELENKIELLQKIIKEKDELVNEFRNGKLMYINKK